MSILPCTFDAHHEDATSFYAFDAHDPDVILRAPLQPGSTQSKDFHVHQLILIPASTLLATCLLSLGPRRGTTLPIIPVTDPAEVFETFLRLAYPIEPPVVTCIQLLDDLFHLAEKYMADGVLEKLKEILVSSSSSHLFLRDDPVSVYAIASRVGLDEQARLAITHSFRIDPVRGVSQAHIDMMTTKTYSRLMEAHATRRRNLISAVNRAKGPPFEDRDCGPWFYTWLCQDITLAILESPIVDRERLYSCTESGREFKCWHGSDCKVSHEAIDRYFTSVLDEMGKVG